MHKREKRRHEIDAEDDDFDPDDMEIIPEKEFLLTAALQIDTTP